MEAATEAHADRTGRRVSSAPETYPQSRTPAQVLIEYAVMCLTPPICRTTIDSCAIADPSSGGSDISGASFSQAQSLHGYCQQNAESVLIVRFSY
jgi:hypothetical protein